MRFDVLTLFPEIFSGYLTQSLLKLAIDRGLVSVHLHNIRDWSRGKHQGGRRSSRSAAGQAC